MQWNDEATQVIKAVAEGKNRKERAALQLSLTTRTIERKVQQFKEHGDACFIHGNSGRPSPNKIPMEEITALITDSPMEGANFTEISRLLKEYHCRSISASTLRKYFFQQGILSPKSKKKTRRKLRKLLKQLKKDKHLSQEAAETLRALEHEKISGFWNHPTKPRAALLGQRIEMDASLHIWIKGLGKLTLHVAIDDASGELAGLWLEEQETLHGYYKVLEQVLTNQGIPFAIRTDRRSVFTYNRMGAANPEKDSMTQFAFACSKLGIDLQCNSDPDFKPKVERANQTLQGMLPYRFGMEGITTIEQANTYLQEVFIPLFNDLFGYRHDYVNGKKHMVKSTYISCTEQQIRNSLVVLSPRIVNKGTTIRIDNQFMELHDASGKRRALAPGTKVTVSRVLDGSLYAISPSSAWYSLHAVPQRYEQDPDEILPPKQVVKKPAKPKPGHPWSYESQMKFREHSKLMKSLEPLYTLGGKDKYA